MKSTLLESHLTKEEEEGASREWLRNDKAKETPAPDGFQSHLELRLGISYFNNSNNNNNETAGEAKGNGPNPKPNGPRSWFSTSSEPSSSTPPIATGGFIHPWSLAARQKAAFEQANTAATFLRVTTPPAIGWPPVRSSRRKLISLKPEMDGEKDAKKGKVISESNGNRESKRKNVIGDEGPLKLSMYVKVHMEGFPVGRKINLKAHNSYESLSSALNKMFTNFLSTNYSNNSAQKEEDEVPNSDFILLYEDHEGDRMLVGDVPWELFITSVERLFIAYSCKKPKKDDGKVTGDQS